MPITDITMPEILHISIANLFSEFANFKAQLLHIFANPYFHMLSREKITRSQFYDSTKKHQFITTLILLIF